VLEGQRALDLGRAVHEVLDVDLGVEGALGLLRVTDFARAPTPGCEDAFPEVGEEILTTVIGYESDNRQFVLAQIAPD